MVVWKLEISGHGGIDKNWVKKASENVPNKSKLPNQLEVDESDIGKLLIYLTSNGVTFTSYAIEKHIVLPPPRPTTPCPCCNGTGQATK